MKYEDGELYVKMFKSLCANDGGFDRFTQRRSHCVDIAHTSTLVDHDTLKEKQIRIELVQSVACEYLGVA